MRYSRILSSVLALSFILVFSMQAENKYVGSKACSMCHKGGKGGTAYSVWEKTAHAKAYETLLSDASKKIAKDKGLKVAANEAPECLKCHVTGGGTAKNVDATFKKEEGVGCEACHGAGSAFKMVHMGGDLVKAKAAGMIIPEKSEKACVTCHNSESPTHKGFKFAEMWAKIEHGKPVQK